MKILFIGNRPNVLESLLRMTSISSIEIFCLSDSPLEEFLVGKNIPFNRFNLSDKKLIIDVILNLQFDILISNGCPFIIPVSKLKKRHQKFINIHPTFLPFLRGATPINGVFYDEMNFFGATMHYMDDGVDTGRIIFQKKISLTQDVDLPMLYYMSFRLESEVFEEGFINHIIDQQPLEDLEAKELGSYFNRTEDKLTINILEDSDQVISRKIKSFGMSHLGCLLSLKNIKLKVFNGTIIKNKKFISWFKDKTPGSILLELDESIYIKTKDSILRIEKFKKI